MHLVLEILQSDNPAMEYSILRCPCDSLNKSVLIINLSMHASISVLATNDFALLKLDERCRSPLVGSLTDKLGMEPGKIEQSKDEFQIFCIYFAPYQIV